MLILSHTADLIIPDGMINHFSPLSFTFENLCQFTVPKELESKEGSSHLQTYINDVLSEEEQKLNAIPPDTTFKKHIHGTTWFGDRIKLILS